MQPLRRELDRERLPEPQIAGDMFNFLNHLRFVAMQCRSMPRTDLFKACALLHGAEDANRQAHAEALVRCLPEALGKPARLLAPGVSETTFDENWLMQLGSASARGDASSMAFLLNSRVGKENRRLIRFLVGRISECFSLY